jgi:hypothetical protein
MPRSGTTLVEQILAAHPSVTAGGELSALGRLAHNLAAGGAPAPADDRALKALADEYMASLPSTPSAEMRVTDKMPLNYQYLSLITAALPAAKVVLCHRDLRDVGLSCFFTDFIDPALGFSRRPDWIGEYLVAFRDHLRRWQQLLGSRMLKLDYESLVTGPEAVIRELLEFVELPWDDRCLRPDKQDRVVTTASHAQVRRSIYRSSVGRWRAYAVHLQPMLDQLKGNDPSS